MSNSVNENLINKYKNETKIITDFYKIIDKGQVVDVNGIINPLKIDNRQLMSPTDNQKEYQACAAFSAATLIESIYWKKTGKLKQLDSLQVYQLAKQLDGIRDQDGTYLECACKAVLDLAKKDTEFKFLQNAKVGLFYNTRKQETIDQTKYLLHKHDFVQVGFNIDQGWYNCTNDNYVLNTMGVSIGGHAVNICGYDNEGFYVLNQWGSSWGSKGYAIMPYKLFLIEFMYGAYIYDFSL